MTRGFEPRRQGERPTILIVEEGADSTSAPDEAFVSRGFAVLRADNTTEGLRIANRRWPDLILLDLKSAENAAAGFLRDLRMQLPTEPLPVLMITSGSDSKSRINALESGADDCLSRPFALDELFGRIEAILRRTLRQTDHRKT
ncbi:MAG: response regulator transcription factor, partial [Nitrospinota bacterium]